MTDWNQKSEFTLQELIDLVKYSMVKKPSNKVKSKSSYDSGVMNCLRAFQINMTNVAREKGMKV